MFPTEVATRKLLLFHNPPVQPATLLAGSESDDELSLTLFCDALW